MAEYYPPIAFHFEASVDGSNGSNAQFQSVSGLEAELEVDSIKEGGLNSYIHKLPKRMRYPNLVLKRGLLAESSALLTWVRDQMLSETNLDNFKTKKIEITLKNEKGEKVMFWNIKNAFPVKWSVSEFDAQKNAIVVESIEFAYQSFTVE